MEHPNDTHNASVFSTNCGRAGIGSRSDVGTCPERSSVPNAGSPSDWGINSIGYIMIDSGGSCLFSLNVRGEILSSSISQRPAHGRLQRVDWSSYVYTSQAGYRGSDTFSVRATGRGPTSSGTSIITVNATLQ